MMQRLSTWYNGLTQRERVLVSIAGALGAKVDRRAVQAVTGAAPQSLLHGE